MTQKAPSRPIIVSHYHDATAYQTKDGSEIRELMHPAQHSNQKQSLAEARVKSGQTTQPHKHRNTEELYYILQGMGDMHLNERCFSVKPGDCICIPPDTIHHIHNPHVDELVFLCCCSPAYSHDDTELVEA